MILKTKTSVTGSEILCKSLESLGIQHVFGLPGSQNIVLFEALRQSKIKTILTTHELAASFMANGYYRSSGNVGVVVTIPGPGFTYALTGIAEAFLDSVAMLCIVGKPACAPGNKFQLQAINQSAMATPVVKSYYRINKTSEIQPVIYEAYKCAVTSEPGPVIIEVDSLIYNELHNYNTSLIQQYSFHNPVPDNELVNISIALIAKAKRILIYAGQGAIEAAQKIQELAELIHAPVVTTTSGRGILAEDHNLSFAYNFVSGSDNIVNKMIQESDLILALGCKFSHNGSCGFKYKIPEDKLIHVDASANILNANYPAQLAIKGSVFEILEMIIKKKNEWFSKEIGWDQSSLNKMHKLAICEQSNKGIEPKIKNQKIKTVSMFFQLLRKILPNNAIVLSDSGLHQMLLRKYFSVLSPGSFIIPVDYQSMGYGIPAAIGAKLANPDRIVVLITGDGGFNISAMELLTAVREKIAINVILFNDGNLGLIKLKQLYEFGHDFAVKLKNPDYEKFAKSIGIEYYKIDSDIEAKLKHYLFNDNSNLIEVDLTYSLDFYKSQVKSKIRKSLDRILRRMIPS